MFNDKYVHLVDQHGDIQLFLYLKEFLNESILITMTRWKKPNINNWTSQLATYFDADIQVFACQYQR